ncbi:MAG: hypothetical protein SGI74_05305 [Oligoflexia bacterium]|nr:hypothetical protein [Oligoflexia bacterium]
MIVLHLFALPQSLRPKYCSQINHLLSLSNIEKVKMLLICLEYPQEKIASPPFSLDNVEVYCLYYKYFEIKATERVEDTFLPSMNLKYFDVQVYETVYWIVKLAR